MSAVQPAGLSPQVPTLADTGLGDEARESRSKGRLAAGLVAIALLAFVPVTIVELPGTNINVLAAAFQTSQIGWVQTIVPIVGMMVALPVGRLGDLYGKKLVLGLQGLITLLGCVVCALTHSFTVFLVGRGMMGVGLALMVTIYGLVRDIYPRRWVPAAIGATTMGYSVGRSVGNLGGAYIVEHYSYVWLFWVMAVIALVGTGLTLVLIPETPLRTRKAADWHGMGLIAVGIFAVTYGLNEASVPQRGWGSPWTLGFLGSGIVLCLLWYLYERSDDFAGTVSDLLRDRRVRRTLIVVLLASTLYLVLETGYALIASTPPVIPNPADPQHPLSLGYGHGWSAMTSSYYGFASMSGSTIGVVLVALHTRRRGPWMPTVLGAAGLTLALVTMSFAATGVLPLEAALVLYGLGSAGVLTSFPILLIEAVPAHDQGIAGALLIILQNAATSIATQYVVAIDNHHVALSIGQTAITAHSGLLWDLGIGAVIGAAALVAALFVPHGRVGASGGALPNPAALDSFRRGPRVNVATSAPARDYPSIRLGGPETPASPSPGARPRARSAASHSAPRA